MRAKYFKTASPGEPEEISEILGKVIESAAVGVDVRQAEMVDRWEAIVPAEWASAEPVGVRDGVLLVEVTDGAAASILRYQMDPLMTAIAHEFGADLVGSVRVKIKRG